MRQRRAVLLWLASALVLVCGPASLAQEAAELAARGEEALAAQRWTEAAELYRKAAAQDPANPLLRYNLAAALAQQSRLEEAEQALRQALEWGFVDLFHLERDPLLAPLRRSKTYRAVLAGWRRLLDARGQAELEVFRKQFGGRFLYERDETLRLLFVSAHDEQTLAEVRRELAALARWAERTLFPMLDGAEASDRPDPWVVVVLPEPEDFVRMVGAADTGGWYDHDHRRIIAQDLGPSLRHEFLHALHWRALTRTGQRHPEWIMEGLGALVEELAIGDDGSVRVVPTSRTNVARTLARRNRLVPVERFVSQGRRRFMGSRPLAHYAQAQTIMLYLHSQGLLGKFLRSCFETIEEDPTGLTALTRAAGATPAEFDEALRRFAAALPEVPERLAPGMASLGAALSLGRGDGPRVAAVRPGSSAWKAGLRRGDVIEALDGWTVRTLEALRWGLAQRAVGEQVALRVRRGRRRLTVQLPLVDAREELALERAPAYGP